MWQVILDPTMLCTVAKIFLHDVWADQRCQVCQYQAYCSVDGAKICRYGTVVSAISADRAQLTCHSELIIRLVHAA